MPIELRRLAQVLGMCGSAHDGEALNAARLATRMLKEEGKTWEQVLAVNGHADNALVAAAGALLAENAALKAEIEDLRQQLQRSRVLATPDHWRAPWSIYEKLESALTWTAVLSDWEREFVVSISGRRSLTPKQQSRLDEITEKIERIARARGIA